MNKNLRWVSSIKKCKKYLKTFLLKHSSLQFLLDICVQGNFKRKISGLFSLRILLVMTDIFSFLFTIEVSTFIASLFSTSLLLLLEHNVMIKL